MDFSLSKTQNVPVLVPQSESVKPFCALIDATPNIDFSFEKLYETSARCSPSLGGYHISNPWYPHPKADAYFCFADPTGKTFFFNAPSWLSDLSLYWNLLFCCMIALLALYNFTSTFNRYKRSLARLLHPLRFKFADMPTNRQILRQIFGFHPCKDTVDARQHMINENAIAQAINALNIGENVQRYLTYHKAHKILLAVLLAVWISSSLYFLFVLPAGLYFSYSIFFVLYILMCRVHFENLSREVVAQNVAASFLMKIIKFTCSFILIVLFIKLFKLPVTILLTVLAFVYALLLVCEIHLLAILRQLDIRQSRNPIPPSPSPVLDLIQEVPFYPDVSWISTHPQYSRYWRSYLQHEPDRLDFPRYYEPTFSEISVFGEPHHPYDDNGNFIEFFGSDYEDSHPDAEPYSESAPDLSSENEWYSFDHNTMFTNPPSSYFSNLIDERVALVPSNVPNARITIPNPIREVQALSWTPPARRRSQTVDVTPNQLAVIGLREEHARHQRINARAILAVQDPSLDDEYNEALLATSSALTSSAPPDLSSLPDFVREVLPPSDSITKPQGYPQLPIAGTWISEFKKCPRVYSTIWTLLNDTLAQKIQIELSLLKSCFNGEPHTLATKAARAAGIPRIVTASELTALLGDVLPSELSAQEKEVQRILNALHQSTPGRLARSHTRLYTTMFTKLRKKESDVFAVMRIIRSQWTRILETFEHSRSVVSIVSAHKYARRTRPIRTSTIVTESLLRKALDTTAPSSEQASSSSEPPLDEAVLQAELDDFARFADALVENRTKVRTPPPAQRDMKFSSKKVAKRVTKELRQFQQDLELDNKFKPTRPQSGASSWIMSILSTLTSKNFHYGLHMVTLIACVVIIACKSSTAFRLGASLVGANSLMSLYQLWNTTDTVALGAFAFLPKINALARSLSVRLSSTGSVVAESIVSFFTSLLKTICESDISGALSSLFYSKEGDVPALPTEKELLDAAKAELRKSDSTPPPPPVASSSNEISAQNWGFIDFFKDLASSFMELIFGTLDSKTLANRLRNFTIGIIAVRHAKDIFIAVQHFIVKTCNWISLKILNVELFDGSGYRFAAEVDDLVKQSPEVMRIIRSPVATPEEILVAEQWSVDLRRVYFANLHRDHKDLSMAALLRIYHGFSTVQAQFAGKMSESQSRIEPVGILFKGKAGKGKTGLISLMIDYLFEFGVCSNKSQFNRQPESDYEEGHTYESHYIFDEFMTANDAELRTEHARLLLSLINTAVRPINYASVDNKGVHQDKSEFIWCTTNSGPESWKELLADVDAITRRFALQISPIVPGKGMPTTPEGHVDWRQVKYECTRYGDDNPQIMTLDQMVIAIAEARIQRVKHHQLRAKQTIEQKLAFLTDADATRKHISDLLATVQPVKPQALTDSYVRERLFVKFASLRNVDLVLQEATWIEVLQDAVQHLDNSDWQPAYRLSEPPKDKDDYPLAIAYSCAVGDGPMGRALQQDYTRITTDRRNEFQRYGIMENGLYKPAPLWVQKYFPRFDKFIDWVYLKYSMFHPWKWMLGRTTSVLNSVILATSAVIFSTLMSIAAIAIGITVALKTLLAPTPTVVNVSPAPRYGTLPQSARDKEERIRARKAKIINNRNRIRNISRKPKAQAHDPSFALLAADHYCYIETSPYVPGARAVGLKDHLILTNHHVLRTLKTYEQIHIRTSTARYPVKVKDLIIVEDAEDDLAILQLPKQVPAFRDITHRFITDDDLLSLGSQYVRAVHSSNNMINCEWSIDYKEPNIIAYADDNSETYHPYGLSLPLPGIAGDCGTLLATFANDLASRNLLGIHCAGNDTLSQYTLVTQELLKIMLDELTAPQGYKEITVTPPSLSTKTTHAVGVNTNLSQYLLAPKQAELIGIISPPSHIPRKSKLRASLFYNKFGKPKREPAVMSNTDIRCGLDPLSTAYANMKMFTDVLFPDFMDEAANQCFRFVKSTTIPRRTLSLTEVCLGIGSLPRMVLDTSSGYPENQHPDAVAAGDSTKGFFIKVINYEKREVWVHPDIEKRFYDDLDLLSQGIIPDWYFDDKLKDELRELEKIHLGKTRVFMAASLVCHMVGRALFGAVIAASDDSRANYPGKSSCAVGSQNFDQTIMQMHKDLYDPNITVHAHDQKGFDYHQHEAPAMSVGRAINRWYNEPEFNLARLTYIKTCYNSVHVSGNICYRLIGHGLPSGVFFTAHFNSWVLETLSLCALHQHSIDQYKSGESSKVVSLRQLKNGIFALYYGDDSWIAIPKGLIQISGSKFFQLYRQYGLETTHCVKNWPADEVVPPEEITFLKRKVFINEDGFIGFALPKDHIYDMLNYIYKKHLTSAQIYNSTARNMLTEIAWYGKREFDLLSELMQKNFAEVKMDLTIPTDFASYAH